mgnify:CR=1 FL=1
MARNEHKKVLEQLSEAYRQVHEGVDPKIKAYRNYMWDVGEYRKDTAGYDHPPTASDYGLEQDEIADLARKAHAPEGEDAEIELDINKVVDPEFDGIDGRDYPDFSDAYITAASYEVAPGEYRDLTDDEIDWVMDKHGDWFYENLMDWIY